MKQVINGFTINIEPDHYSESPRKWFNIGRMICFHGRYDIGDDHSFRSEDYNGWDELLQAIRQEYDVVVALPVYLYDHGGVSVSTRSFVGRAPHASWDSGQVGFIFADRDGISREFGWKRITAKRREKLENMLRDEIEVLDQWMRGEVYLYDIVDPDGNHVDSCAGFYGEEYALEAAEAVIAANI